MPFKPNFYNQPMKSKKNSESCSLGLENLNLLKFLFNSNDDFGVRIKRWNLLALKNNNNKLKNGTGM